MQMASASEQLVPLRGGFSAPVWAIEWLIDSEHRGLRFSVLPDGRLHVGPRDVVDAADVVFIRKHKVTILAAVTYCNSIAAQPL
jgi:hypothetical protein